MWLLLPSIPCESVSTQYKHNNQSQRCQEWNGQSIGYTYNMENYFTLVSFDVV